MNTPLSHAKPEKRLRTHARQLLLACLMLGIAFGVHHRYKPLPAGLSYAGQPAVAEDILFLADKTWVDEKGERHVEQQIFDEILRLIGLAEKLIVVDMFLYNDFQGPTAETTRALAKELTDALVTRKRERPNLEIVVISDPVNTVYGGLPSPFFAQLRAAGVPVVITDLPRLRDSNPIYSVLWRALFKPFGNAKASTLPNPIGPGRVSLRSYLALINFKANHRKVLIADNDAGFVGLVSSANPHDGSSAHSNAAVRFSGRAVADLLHAENAVLAFSGHPEIALHDLPLEQAAKPPPPDANEATVQVVTESKIEDAVLRQLGQAATGDEVDLMMFYLSDRHVIMALKQAHSRGARLRVLLDPNKDAFGREKNGVPNRPVADELTDAGIDVRWCDTHGEQCHAKMMIIRHANDRAALISGSANFTRRNLDDLNLELDVVVEGQYDQSPFAAAAIYFDSAWNNTETRRYSVAYEAYEDDSYWHRFLYRIMEASGISSF